MSANIRIMFLGEKKKSIIGIAPFAAYKSKMYPLELIKKAIADLDKQYQIVLFGGGDKGKFIDENIEGFKNKDPNMDIVEFFNNKLKKIKP